MSSSHEHLVSGIPPEDMRFVPISQQVVWDCVSNDPVDHITGSLADHIMGSDHITEAPDLESTLVFRRRPRVPRPRVPRPRVRPPSQRSMVSTKYVPPMLSMCPQCRICALNVKYVPQCHVCALNVKDVPSMSSMCPQYHVCALSVTYVPQCQVCASMSSMCPQCHVCALNVKYVPQCQVCASMSSMCINVKCGPS